MLPDCLEWPRPEILSTALGSLLFGVTSGDRVTYIAVGTLLILVAAIADIFLRGEHPGSIRCCIAIELNGKNSQKY